MRKLLIPILFLLALACGGSALAADQAPDPEPAPIFSTGGQQVRADLGLGATYALIGMNLEYAPFRYGSLFVGLTGARDAFFGVTGGARAYPLGNDNDVNLFVHGFGGFIGLVVDSDELDGDVYGVSYYGAGGGLEFLMGRKWYLRLGADWVHAEGSDYALPLIGFSGKL